MTTRLSINVTDRVADELDAEHRASGLSKTDIVNRAVSLYRFVERERASGQQLALYDPEREEFRLVTIT